MEKSIKSVSVRLFAAVAALCLFAAVSAGAGEQLRQAAKKKPAAPSGVYLTKDPGKGLRIIGGKGTGNGQFGFNTGLAQGPDGSLYVSDAGNARIQQLTWDGKFVRAWGSAGSGNGQFLGMRGVAVGADGSVFVNDGINFRIQKFSATGQYLMKWGDNAKQWQPQAIDIGGDGNIYLCDTFKSRVQIFKQDGSLVRIIDVIEEPFRMAVGPDNSIYLPDTPNIFKFNNLGKQLKQWGGFGSGPGQFGQIANLTTTFDGTLYVTDPSYKKIHQYDANDNFIRRFGSEGEGLGQFRNPQAIAGANDGSLYVFDSTLFRIMHVVGGTWRATGASTTVSGTVTAPEGVDVTTLTVRIDGTDPKSKIAFYLEIKPAANGSFSFIKFPVKGKYKLTLSGFDTALYHAEPASRKGRAKGATSGRDFALVAN